MEITSQKDFNDHCWNGEKIKNDYKHNKNVELIWRIVKYYLLKKGFKERLGDIKNTNIDFSAVPVLN